MTAARSTVVRYSEGLPKREVWETSEQSAKRFSTHLQNILWESPTERREMGNQTFPVHVV